jgi:hypothetical protein
VVVTIPAGAVSGAGTITARSIAPPASAPTGTILVGSSYDVEVTGAKLTGTATLRLPAAPPSGPSGRSPPDAVLVAFYDTATHSWTPVATTYDAVAHTATVATSHLSIWSVISVDTKALTDQAFGALKAFLGTNNTATQPTCSGTAEASSKGIKATSSSGSMIKWCLGLENGQTILRLANDRGFALEADYPAAWSLQRDGWSDVDAAVVEGIASVATIAPKGQRAAIIPGSETVTFTIPAGGSGVALATTSGVAYLASAFVYGVNTLVMTTGKVPFAPAPKTNAVVKAIQSVFTSKDCVSSMQGLATANVADPSGIADVFWQDLHLASGCLGDQWEKAYGGPGFLVSFIVDAFLWLVDGIKLVGQGLGGAFESIATFGGYSITVTAPAAAAQPILGTSWTSYQQGYGTVRPAVIFNGGDPTGAVQNVTWSSWGGPTATGSGISDHVGPGQNVASGTLATATVVAFHLGICKGKLMYQAIEWYFPEYGDHFDPGVYIDICTGAYVGE